jgi:hypothetical protein
LSREEEDDEEEEEDDEEEEEEEEEYVSLSFFHASIILNLELCLSVSVSSLCLICSPFCFLLLTCFL